MFTQQIKPDVRMIENSLENFRFIFEDGTTVNIKAENIDKATVLAMADRIKRKKTTSLLGVLARNSDGVFQAVQKDSVTISLKQPAGTSAQIRTFR